MVESITALKNSNLQLKNTLSTIMRNESSKSSVG